MAKEFARDFYNSKAWYRTRTAYARSRKYLCEICLAKGIYKAADIVHHKIHLTPENINDPKITLNWENLQCVCRACHAEVHDMPQYYKQMSAARKFVKKRYFIDENGRVITKKAPPCRKI